MLEMLSVALPVFWSVMTWAVEAVRMVWPANVRLEGEMVAIGAGADTPVPVSGTEWGDPGASEVMVMAPVRVPKAVGVKVTVIVQLPVAARVAPQVVTLEKSPLATIEAMFRVALPLLVRVMA